MQECLTELFCPRGVPTRLRSDNGLEFTAKMLSEWLRKFNIGTLFIEPGSPWENGCVELFNWRMRDELLDWKIFYTLKEAKRLIDMWRYEYNDVRLHSSPDYRLPAAWIAVQEQFQAKSLT